MRTLVILVCILTTSFYFLSTINASQVDEWEEWSDGREFYGEFAKESLEDSHEQEKCLA